MSSTTAASYSIDVTLGHAIGYLTRSLIKKYSATTILQLQMALSANLTAQYASTWTPSEPLRGSGRRCLTFSANTAPPRAIHSACVDTGVEWSEWVKLLGATEFDMFVDPGCISVRFGNWDAGKTGKLFTIWSANAAATPSPIVARSKVPTLNLAPTKTFAQQLLENDCQDENELFAMVADELREPTWITPILTQFPTVPSHPSSEFSPVSRSSSRASSSSGSGQSFSSSPDSDSSFASDDSLSKMSRRERARQAKVFIDTSKNEVTNYDGGKTTVLTGGVMLGGASSTKKPTSNSPTSSTTSRHSHSSSSSWRASRV